MNGARHGKWNIMKKKIKEQKSHISEMGKSARTLSWTYKLG